MRVVIDFTGSMSTNTGGTTYPLYMLPRWARVHEDHVTAVFSHGQVPPELSSLHCFVELSSRRAVSAQMRVIDLHVGIKRALHEEAPDVAYFPGNFVPLGLPASTPVVAAVRSTIHFDYPSQGGFPRAAMQRLATHYLVRRAARIVVPTSMVAEVLMRRAGAHRRQLVVVPHGVDLEHFRPGDAEERDPGLLLFVSKPWDYKGLLTVMRALREMGRKAKDGELPRLLVVDGGIAAEESAEWRRVAEKLSIADRVEFAGRVDHGGLAALYRSGTALVLPSAYESFGNPYLEAAASGCPVIGPVDEGLDETIGDAAFRVSPHDHVALAGAIRHVIEMGSKARAEHSQRLRAVAERFSWDETLARTREVLREVA